jgi:hypothetical protein
MKPLTILAGTSVPRIESGSARLRAGDEGHLGIQTQLVNSAYLSGTTGGAAERR